MVVFSNFWWLLWVITVCEIVVVKCTSLSNIYSVGGINHIFDGGFDRMDKTVLNNRLEIGKLKGNQELDKYFHIKLLISKYLENMARYRVI